MNHSPTVLEISASAVIHNLSHFRSLISTDTMILGVVKASGYGSDAAVVAKLLENRNRRIIHLALFFPSGTGQRKGFLNQVPDIDQ